MSKSDCAVKCFNSGFNCSQAIFSTYCEQLGLDKETALKISCSFGAGIGSMGETCGAVTGAFMLIGLKCGKYISDDTVSKEHTYKLINDFTAKFKDINGSIKCRDLLSCDISTAEGLKYAREKGLWNTLCPKFVNDSAKIIEEMLDLK